MFDKIYKGKTLPKHYLIDCVLCYIKEKKMDEGFVIIGFSREEIMILEERIARKLYPPFGSNNSVSDKKVTIIVPFKGPGLSDEGRYASSFTSCLKVSRQLFLNNMEQIVKMCSFFLDFTS